jgi:sugar/nucleoside kinase (ribokinase family)
MQSERKLVITIGGANGERVLKIDPTKFQLGSKHSIAPLPIMAGGSAVNYSCRLLAMGIQVFPVLPIIKDDIGKIVVETLKAATKKGKCTIKTSSLYMEGDDLATPFTTILTVGLQRTILNEFPEGIIRKFRKHYDKCLKEFHKLFKKQANAIMVGHIHADRDISLGGQSGGISQSIIEKSDIEKIPVFANFGGSQYKLGLSRWESFLEKIQCFQLDIDEIRDFYGKPALLEEILKWFRDRCTVVITMERLGAIARLRGSDSIIVSWPYDLRNDEIKDPTGAGDAFGAGIVASALEEPLNSDDALQAALEKGRLWGAYACTTVGGANMCPNSKTLEKFKSKHHLFLQSERKSIGDAKPVLKILDRVFFRQI